MYRSVMAIVLCCCAALVAQAGDISISVEEPSGVSRGDWPVTSGIPVARGAMSRTEAASCALFTSAGEQIELQTEVLATWPDQTVRWLLLDFQITLRPHEKQVLVLRYGEQTRRRTVESPVRVSPLNEGYLIDSGPLRCRISAQRFRLFDDVSLDLNGDGTFSRDERIGIAEGAGIVLTTPQGRSFRADLTRASVTVEQSGPMRVCLKVEGRHAADDGTMFGFVMRIHAYRGKPYLRCYYSFINDQPSGSMAQVESLELAFAASDAVAGETMLAGKRDRQGRLVQVDADHYQIDGKPAGRRAAGWGGVIGARAGMAVGLREFWQNWPKAIEVRDNRIVLGVCPDFPAGLYDGKPLLEESKLTYWLRDGVYSFKCGVARTHEFWTLFFKTGDAERVSEFFQAAEEPLLATCAPAYVSRTQAVGPFPPADRDAFWGYDAWLGAALDAHLQRREELHEYGMLNFGDWYGERGVNWGNLEYDLAHGLFLQFLRSGDRRFFVRASQAARHHIDVDVVHATSKDLKNPWGDPPRIGDVWLHSLGHTGGYYDGAALPVSRTYQVGHSTNFGHVWVSGDWNYYHLTGDRRARDVALEISDAMVSHMPTRYGNHIRAIGWPMILVLDAYAATGDEKYLEAARANWLVLKREIDWQRGWVVQLAKGHCRHEDRRCEGNVPFMEGMTLSALARYHRVTQDPEVLKAISVGIDQMIRECWIEDAKTFRYTACPLSPGSYHGLFMLSVEAIAYEVELTGNREHRRILQEGMRSSIEAAGKSGFGKGLAQMIFFAPHGLVGVPTGR